jgi:two-component system invasion response regulator UvrY
LEFVTLIKVLIVDDHSLVRVGICSLLANCSGIKVVAEASSGEEAVKIARSIQPDVVLMDIHMPHGFGGLEATRKLIRMLPDVKIVALTVCEDEVYPTRLLQAGAMGYLTKGCDGREMIQAIRAVFNGQRYLSPVIAQQLALRHVNKQDASPFDSLSERELQVMLMIADGHKAQYIAETLCISPKTVNSYRYRLFEKLKVNSDVELARMAIRQGLVDLQEGEIEEHEAVE